jgi:hypothetical protein
MRFDGEGRSVDGQRTLRQNGALKKISYEMSNRARVPRRDHVSGGHLGSAAPTRTNTVTNPDHLVAFTINTDGRPDPAGGAGPAVVESGRSQEGRDLLVRALMRRPSTYQLQAAIAAVHSEASRPEETDWPQIVALSPNAADHRFLTGRLSEFDVAGADPEGPAAN